MLSSAALAAVLLGVLLAPPGPARHLLALDHRPHREDAIVRRTLLLDDVVADQLATLSQPLLQGRFEIDRVLERVVDLRAEGLHHRASRGLVPRAQEARADHGLDHRRQDALGADQGETR